MKNRDDGRSRFPASLKSLGCYFHIMSTRVNRVLIESSIIFVSVFATLGLLFGTVNSDFKSNYFYLGYMLYFSLPFILSCFLGVVSLVTQQKNPKWSETISSFEVSFFLTGLMLLVLLATSAAQTSALPTTFTYVIPFPLIPILMLVLFFLFEMALSPLIVQTDSKAYQWLANLRVSRKLSKFFANWNRTSDLRLLVALIGVILFVYGIVFMASIGVTQAKFVAKSDSVSLVYNQSNPASLKCENISLVTADQISVQIKGASSDQWLRYVFLDDNNYYTYMNLATTANAQIIKQDMGSDLSFDTVITQTGEYWLILESRSVGGTNATYSVQVTRVDNSNEVKFFFISSFGVCITLSVMNVQFRRKRENVLKYVV